MQDDEIRLNFPAKKFIFEFNGDKKREAMDEYEFAFPVDAFVRHQIEQLNWAELSVNEYY